MNRNFAITCDSRTHFICIPAVIIISFCVSFPSRVDELDKYRFWPASSVWVCIAQLEGHCSANAEATDSKPVEAPKNFFSGYFAIASIAIGSMVTYSLHCQITILTRSRSSVLITSHENPSMVYCTTYPVTQRALLRPEWPWVANPSRNFSDNKSISEER